MTRQRRSLWIGLRTHSAICSLIRHFADIHRGLSLGTSSTRLPAIISTQQKTKVRSFLSLPFPSLSLCPFPFVVVLHIHYGTTRKCPQLMLRGEVSRLELRSHSAICSLIRPFADIHHGPSLGTQQQQLTGSGRGERSASGRECNITHWGRR